MSRFQKFVRDVEQFARDSLAAWPSEWQGYNYPGYVFEHTLRVRHLAIAIAREEGADAQVVELAALLHDTGKPDGEPHSETGVRQAERILSVLGVSEATCSLVCDVILTHLRDDPGDPLENQILRDADFLDANHGYVGYLRHIVIRAHQGKTVEETHASTADWLPKLEEKLEQYSTPTAQTMARERFARMQFFQEQFSGELRRGQRDTASGIVQYVAADGECPSLFRQARELEEIAAGKRVVEHLEPSRFLREFVDDLKREIAGQA